MNKPKQQQVAILATGDEVINGDIVNANASEIARALFNQNIAVGQHLSVGDDVTAIVDSLRYLAQQHAAIIITGGLGPTRDDVTRQALSDYCQLPLSLDDTSLEQLSAFFSRAGLPLANNNRQQAYFPEGATVLVNERGTANGCMLRHNETVLFMLPGPPSEMLPMLERDVLPALQSMRQQDNYFQKWLVFGMGESTLAELIDDTLLKYSDNIGYRFVYPYIEVKLFFQDPQEITRAQDEINQLLATHQRELLHETATTQCKQLLSELTQPIRINDHATGGTLENSIVSPNNYHLIDFQEQAKPRDYLAEFTLSGIRGYWEQRDELDTELLISSQFGEDVLKVRNYGQRALVYGAETAAFYLMDKLSLCK